MPGTDVPGLGEIQAWAQHLGMDIAGTVTKLADLLGTDPAAVRAGADRLGTVASGLDGSHRDIDRAGTELLGSEWSGESREAFRTTHGELGASLAGARDGAGALSTQLGDVAATFERGHQTALTATGATATALRMLRV